MRAMNVHVWCRTLACIWCWFLCPLPPGLCFIAVRSQWGYHHKRYVGIEMAVVYPLPLSELMVLSSVSGRGGMGGANRRTINTVGAVMHGGEAEYLDDPSKMRTEGLGMKGGDGNEIGGKGGDNTTEAHAMEVNKPKRRGRPRKLKPPKLIKQTENEPVVRDNVVEEEGIVSTRVYFVLAFCGNEQQSFAEKCALLASERLGELIDTRLVHTGERMTKKVPTSRGEKWETLVYDPQVNEHLDIWIEGARTLSLFSSSAEDGPKDLPDEADIQSYLVALQEEASIVNQDIYPL